jgi:glycosyltransferase involved in cell wall biosynthesis
MQPEGLSVVIPVLDELQAAARLGERLASIQARATFPLEILVVDDGSRDGTRDHLRSIDLPGLRVLAHGGTRGYGAALAHGITEARHPWIAITDADETYPDERIPELFREALRQDTDMLIGARTGSVVEDPLPRQPPKWALRRLASLVSGTAIPDLNSGLRIMRRAMVERYLHLLPAGMSFTSTITLAALAGGWRVDFVPIDYHRRTGRSKFRPVADTASSLLLVARTVLWFPPLRGLSWLGPGRPHPSDARGSRQDTFPSTAR